VRVRKKGAVQQWAFGLLGEELGLDGAQRVRWAGIVGNLGAKFPGHEARRPSGHE
jgi:hypothetical protein